MIVYNVTVKVNNSVVDKWVKWMLDEHMPDLKNTGLFTDYRLCRLLEQDDTEGVTFSAQYTCSNMEDYNTYIDQYATTMRDKAFKQFGNNFVAFRTVMEVL